MIIERIKSDLFWCEQCDKTLDTEYQVYAYGVENRKDDRHVCYDVTLHYCADCAAMLFNLNNPEIEE